MINFFRWRVGSKQLHPARIRVKVMKKVIFGFVTMIALLTTSCASLRIDKVESDGSRFLSTKDSRLYTGFSTGGAFALTCLVSKDGVMTYSLRVVLNEGSVRISEGRKLMMKTDSGKIIELTNLFYVGPGSYEDIYPNVVAAAYYGLTEEQINQIIKGNIVKIRIETDGKMIDHNLNSNQLSSGLKEKYETIKVALKEKKSVYSDF